MVVRCRMTIGTYFFFLLPFCLYLDTILPQTVATPGKRQKGCMYVCMYVNIYLETILPQQLQLRENAKKPMTMGNFKKRNKEKGPRFFFPQTRGRGKSLSVFFFFFFRHVDAENHPLSQQASRSFYALPGDLEPSVYVCVCVYVLCVCVCVCVCLLCVCVCVCVCACVGVCVYVYALPGDIEPGVFRRQHGAEA